MRKRQPTHCCQARWSVAIVLLVTALVAGACARVAATPSPSPSPSVVPWLALPAGHQYPQAPEASPSPPLSAPPGTPTCAAPQLEGVGIMGGAATGHLALPVILRNRGATACSLEGYPDISILDAGGRVLAQTAGAGGRGTFFADGPVVKILMEPGTAALDTSPGPGYRGVLGQAFMNVEWYDCAHRQASTLVLTLPDAGGRLSVPFAFAGPDSPACPNPGYSSYLARGPLSPSAIAWSPQPQYIAVAITISAPATVRRGSTLAYMVTITNLSGQDYHLDPCPDYNELVGPKAAVAEYQLNCAPVGTIAAGSRATFAMRISIPTTMSSGTTKITWALLDGRIDPRFANAALEIL